MEIITSIGIDKIENEIGTTISVINAHEDPPALEHFHTTGPNLNANLDFFNNQLENSLYFGHLTSLIIGENLAKDGIFPYLEYFIKHPSLHLNFPLLIAKDNTAKNLLTENDDDSPETENNTNHVMTSFSHLTDAHIEIIINHIKTPGIEATIPTVQLSDDLLDEETDLIKTKTAVLRNDLLVGYLSEDATIGLKLIKNQHENLNLPVSCNNINTTIDIDKSRLRFEKRNNIYHLNFNINGTSNDNSCTNQEIKKSIKKYINLTIKESQRLGSDIIGIGRYSRIFHNTNLTGWNQKYQNIEIKPVINLNLTNAKSTLRGGA